MRGHGTGDRAVVTDDGVRLRTRVDGPDDAPTLLLCNSLGTDMSLWDAQLDSWSVHRRVVRFDQRGHGGSQAPPPPYDIERLGNDALVVLDAYEVDRADVCGLSLGGLVALWVAARAPERVRRLVLADTAARVGGEAAWRDRAATVREQGMGAVVDPVLDRFFSPGFRETEHPDVERVSEMLHATPVDGYVGSCEALATADLRALLPAVRAPTLVVVGTADEATPPGDARDLAEAIPSARSVELPDAGHLANLEVPDAFARHVREFLVDGPVVNGPVG